MPATVWGGGVEGGTVVKKISSTPILGTKEKQVCGKPTQRVEMRCEGKKSEDDITQKKGLTLGGGRKYLEGSGEKGKVVSVNRGLEGKTGEPNVKRSEKSSKTEFKELAEFHAGFFNRRRNVGGGN